MRGHMRCSLGVLTALLTLSGASGETRRWRGTVDSNWFEPGNWMLPGDPLATDELILNLAGYYAWTDRPVDVGDASEGLVSVERASVRIENTVTINSGGTLELIRGDLTVGGLDNTHGGRLDLVGGALRVLPGGLAQLGDAPFVLGNTGPPFSLSLGEGAELAFRELTVSEDANIGATGAAFCAAGAANADDEARRSGGSLTITYLGRVEAAGVSTVDLRGGDGGVGPDDNGRVGGAGGQVTVTDGDLTFHGMMHLQGGDGGSSGVGNGGAGGAGGQVHVQMSQRPGSFSVLGTLDLRGGAGAAGAAGQAAGAGGNGGVLTFDIDPNLSVECALDANVLAGGGAGGPSAPGGAGGSVAVSGGKLNLLPRTRIDLAGGAGAPHGTDGALVLSAGALALMDGANLDDILQAGAFEWTAGTVEMDGNLTLSKPTLAGTLLDVTPARRLSVRRSVTIAAGGAMEVSGGTVTAEDGLRLEPGGSLSLHAGRVSCGAFDNAGGTFTWTGGTLGLLGDLRLASDTPLGAVGGDAITPGRVLDAGNSLVVEPTGVLALSGGRVECGSFDNTHGGTFHWNSGTLAFGSDLVIDANFTLHAVGGDALTAGRVLDVAAELTITDGQEVVVDGGGIAGDVCYLGAEAGTGTLTLTGPGSAAEFRDSLGIGAAAAGGPAGAPIDGTLNILAGAVVTGRAECVVGLVEDANGLLVVSGGDGEGSPSTFRGGKLLIGWGPGMFFGSGGMGEVVVEDGGLLEAPEGCFPGTGGIGQLRVRGAGSRCDANGILAGFGGAGTVEVTDGGRIDTHLFEIGHVMGAGQGLVSGSGSAVVVTPDPNIQSIVHVGGGGWGELTIAGGGLVDANTDAVVAGGAGFFGGEAIAVVDGSGSAWRVGGGLYVGGTADGDENMQGALTVRNGGTLTVAGPIVLWNSRATLSLAEGSITCGGMDDTHGGLLTHTGGTLTIDGGYYDVPAAIYVLAGPDGPTLVLRGGAVMQRGQGCRIGTTLGPGAMVVTGQGTTASVQGAMTVGRDPSGHAEGPDGTLEILDGGMLWTSAPPSSVGLAAGSEGRVTIAGVSAEGGSSRWLSNGGLYLGGSSSQDNGGAGSVTVRDGGQLILGGPLVLWNAGTSLTLDGGEIGCAALGNTRGGTFDWRAGQVGLELALTIDSNNPFGVAGGGDISAGRVLKMIEPLTIGSTGELRVTGGEVIVFDTLALAGAGSSLTLDGGRIECTALDNAAGGSFTWPTGTLVLESDVTVAAGGPFGTSPSFGPGRALETTGRVTFQSGGAMSLDGGSLVCADLQDALGALTMNGGACTILPGGNVQLPGVAMVGDGIGAPMRLDLGLDPVVVADVAFTVRGDGEVAGQDVELLLPGGHAPISPPGSPGGTLSVEAGGRMVLTGWSKLDLAGGSVPGTAQAGTEGMGGGAGGRVGVTGGLLATSGVTYLHGGSGGGGGAGDVAEPGGAGGSGGAGGQVLVDGGAVRLAGWAEAYGEAGGDGGDGGSQIVHSAPGVTGGAGGRGGNGAEVQVLDGRLVLEPGLDMDLSGGPGGAGGMGGGGGPGLFAPPLLWDNGNGGAGGAGGNGGDGGTITVSSGGELVVYPGVTISLYGGAAGAGGAGGAPGADGPPWTGSAGVEGAPGGAGSAGWLKIAGGTLTLAGGVRIEDVLLGGSLIWEGGGIGFPDHVVLDSNEVAGYSTILPAGDRLEFQGGLTVVPGGRLDARAGSATVGGDVPPPPAGRLCLGAGAALSLAGGQVQCAALECTEGARLGYGGGELTVTDDVTLGGLLAIDLVPVSRDPNHCFGRSYDILTYGGELAGAFSGFDGLVGECYLAGIDYTAEAAGGLKAVRITLRDPLDGDCDLDGDVDGDDLAAIEAGLHAPGPTWLEGDVSLDGVVDHRDYLLWKANTGRSVPDGTAPEPAALALLVGVWAFLLVRPRRIADGRNRGDEAVHVP